MSILIFFIILGVLVISHEFGHFIVAKMSGMRVDEFGFGFPPRIWGKEYRGTLYSINAIPFGGFVKIYGEDPTIDHHDSRPKESFASRPLYQQAAVVLAGVFFNFLLGWALISLGYIIGLPSSVAGAPVGARVENASLVVTGLQSGSPAEKAGLHPGDELVYLVQGDRRVEDLTPEKVQSFIGASGEKEIVVGYKRGDEAHLAVAITPVSGIVSDRPAIGISMDLVGTLHLPFFIAIREGFLTAWALILQTLGALYGLVYGLLVGKANLGGVSGPVGIVSLVGDASALGFVYLLSLTAAISLNLAVMNLVPFPALDGGRLLLILIEAVRGREIHPRIAHRINTTGFALLLLLMAVLTYSDIAKLIHG